SGCARDRRTAAPGRTAHGGAGADLSSGRSEKEICGDPLGRVSRSMRILPLLLGLLAALAEARAPMVLLTDFGTQDGAVSAMKGVAYSVSQDLLISDLSHENPSIFAGPISLFQTSRVWPNGRGLVAVVDR